MHGFMTQPLSISRLKHEVDAQGEKVSAWVGDTEIWFRTPPGTGMTARIEPFIAAALLEAMVSGADIQLPQNAPVSQRLLESLKSLQAIYHGWNKKLSRVAIHAEADANLNKPARVGSFYSAGVDSSYSFLRHSDEITHLITLDAFDDPVPEEIWQRYIARQSAFAQSFGKSLLPVTTNVRQFSEQRRISWEFMHGLILASVGNILAMGRIYIPSSYTYRELFPWGSHPLTDPMWSTESCEVIHDGAESQRWEKVRAITADQKVLDNLHVCWRSKTSNCGRCPKCVRTMAALHLLQAKTDVFPAYQGVAELKSVDAHEVAFLRDAIMAAQATGNAEISRKLGWLLKKYELLQLVEAVDKTLLGGLVRKTYRRIKKPKWLNARVTLES